jgi:flagellar hook assembly protein FlgD
LELTTRLDQNYPNPFASSTTIQFNLAEPGAVRLEIYDVIGRKVATLVDGSLSAGTHAVSWDGSSVPNGIYFYTLTRAGAHTRAPGAMVVVR